MHWSQNTSPPLTPGTYTGAYFILQYYNLEEDSQGSQNGYTFYAEMYESKTYYDTEVAAGRTPNKVYRADVPFVFTDHPIVQNTRHVGEDGEAYYEQVASKTTDWSANFPGIDTLDEFASALQLYYGATIHP